LLLFRIAWGVAGSDTARFTRFLRSPLAGLRHLGQFRRRGPDTEIGHNAAGGWMVLVLLGLLLVQAVSGLFANHEPGMTYDAHGPLALKVSDGTSAWLTDVHHFNWNLVLGAVGLHVLAVLAYRVVKGHDLIGPMVTGLKSLPARMAAPRMGSPVLAAGFLTAAALAVWGITRLG
jgi:cytochrome b